MLYGYNKRKALLSNLWRRPLTLADERQDKRLTVILPAASGYRADRLLQRGGASGTGAGLQVNGAAPKGPKAWEAGVVTERPALLFGPRP